MTNYNERLDVILSTFDGGIHGKGSERGGYPTYFTEPYPLWVGERKRATKQALTSLIKQLVAEAKPVRKLPESGDSVAVYYEKMLYEFEQNLLKALEEK